MKVKKSQLLSPDPSSPTKSFNQIINKNILRINNEEVGLKEENSENIQKIRMPPSSSIAKINSSHLKEDNIFTGVNK